ncbi:MAG: inositol monophosphatase [Chloroflexi bacterium]|nr:inositol monophosphatase [Chloroflexota bacterium]
MSDPSLSQIAEVAAEAARAGGQILRDSYGRVQSVRFKGATDLVTEVDVRAEHAIVALLQERFPTHQILAEEGSVGGDDPRHRWIVDPLDGTTNFAHGLRVFSVSVGYERDGTLAAGAVYDPSQDELFQATAGGGATVNGQPIRVSKTDTMLRALLGTGFPYDRALMPIALRQFSAVSMQVQAVRRVGSAALDCCWVAAGRFDGYWENVVNAWDVAAGALIAIEAGAAITDVKGNPFRVDSGSILVANPALHGQILATVTEASREA